MSDSKTERELNLLFVLLNAKRPIEREEIRKRVPGYFGKSDDAFERAFERDKKMLRETIGAPVKTVQLDKFHEDEFGYIIDPDEWQLPELKLTSAERALLNLASSAWAHTQLGPALADAALRLGDDSEIQSPIHLDLARQSEHIEKVLRAQSQGKCVEFTYYSRNSNSVDERLIAPWRLFLSDGNSYLIGFDQLKGEQRIFKISRIVGEVSISAEDSIENAPIDLKPAQLIANWQDNLATLIDAHLEIRNDQAGELRLLASNIDSRDQFDLVEIRQIDQDRLVRLIAKNCDQVRVISPTTLRDEVQKILAGVAL